MKQDADPILYASNIGSMTSQLNRMSLCCRVYLKSLCAHMWNTQASQGTFVPAKAWLITTLDTYRTLVCTHNNYITNVTAIKIEAMVAEKEIEVENKKVTIKHYLQTMTTLIELMKMTNNSGSKGK
eukprot:15353802-Ditylum_brightwellii.AAC.1